LGAIVKKMGVKSHVERDRRVVASILISQAMHPRSRAAAGAARQIARGFAQLALRLCISGKDVRIRMC
jgi:hypothetical protein